MSVCICVHLQVEIILNGFLRIIEEITSQEYDFTSPECEELLPFTFYQSSSLP